MSLREMLSDYWYAFQQILLSNIGASCKIAEASGFSA